MSNKHQLRHESRIVALKVLFYFLERKQERPLSECFEYVLKELEEVPKKSDDFAWNIVNTGVENIGKIKVIMRAFAPEFTFEKIAPINRALLILGIGEMKFMETPPIVVINEYIELAKEFGEERSPSFVNGVLDNYRKGLGLEREKKS